MTLQAVQVVDPNDASNTLTANVYAPAHRDPSKATIVMLPFWGGYAETYRAVQERVATQCPAHGSIALSFRGTGAAPDKERDTDHRQWSISLVSASIARFLRSRAVTELVPTARLVLCGHSWSAKVALSFLMRDAAGAGAPTTADAAQAAQAAAEPASLAVHGLVFLGPAPATPIILDDADRAYRSAAYASTASATAAIRSALAHRPLPAAAVHQLAAHMAAMSPAAKRSWLEVGIWEDWSADLRDFAARHPARRVPVRVVVADHDVVEPPDEVRRLTVAPLTELGFEVAVEELADCGHLMPLEALDAVADALQRSVMA